jgi:hypothetical protein
VLVQRTERLPRTLARRVLDMEGYGAGRGNGGLQHRQASVPVKRTAQAVRQSLLRRMVERHADSVWSTHANT